jgi:predicted flap endonuclease-1-like 5' DNA nuclease
MIDQWLEGLETDTAARIREHGIRSLRDLLRVCPTRADVEQLAATAALDPSYLLAEWNRAKLHGIRGVGSTYIVLLEQIGVASPTDLAKLHAEDLRARIVAVNAERKVVGRIPALPMVNGWITRAKQLL